MLIFGCTHLLLAWRAGHDPKFRIGLTIGTGWHSLLSIYDRSLHRIYRDILRSNMLLLITGYLLNMIDVNIVDPVVVVSHIQSQTVFVHQVYIVNLFVYVLVARLLATCNLPMHPVCAFAGLGRPWSVALRKARPIVKVVLLHGLNRASTRGIDRGLLTASIFKISHISWFYTQMNGNFVSES